MEKAVLLLPAEVPKPQGVDYLAEQYLTHVGLESIAYIWNGAPPESLFEEVYTDPNFEPSSIFHQFAHLTETYPGIRISVTEQLAQVDTYTGIYGVFLNWARELSTEPVVDIETTSFSDLDIYSKHTLSNIMDHEIVATKDDTKRLLTTHTV